jgi:simple sugar transport system permease protein
MLASRIGFRRSSRCGYLMPSSRRVHWFLGWRNGQTERLRTFGGAVLVGILENGLVMMSVPYYSLNIFKGAVLVIALALTYFRKK